MTADLLLETIWYDQWRCNDAERDHYTRLGGGVPQSGSVGISATAEVEMWSVQSLPIKNTNGKYIEFSD